MHYNRLALLVLTVNLAVFQRVMFGDRWWPANGIDLKTIALIAQSNLALAIIIRQQYVINLLCRLATRAPTTWPLRVRWLLAKVYHFGGLHVGAAISGTLWFLAFVGLLTYEAARPGGNASIPNVITSFMLVCLLITMVLAAVPSRRARRHDRFEATHRFCGWAALVLVWTNTVLFVISQRGDTPTASALLTAPNIWIITVTTLSAAIPWARLRKVPVTVVRPSDHVALTGFDHGVTPFIGSVRPISRHPLYGWHTFANVCAPVHSPGGYRMIISRAGDWTSEFIDDPPSHVWVRGIPTAGMANVRKLFRKVVYVATGSGIGPMLAHLLANEVPAHLVWVTRNPRKTYGDELVDEILAVQPDATIWDSDEHGKPDVLRLAYDAYMQHGAEAVICIANKKVTWHVVEGLESRGIPACGPIWDS